MNTEPEPWLRGPIPGVPPLFMPVLASFKQVREDLARHTAGLADSALWQKVGGNTLGFHLKHIAGSVDRLTTYLAGSQLSDFQLAELKQEAEPSGTLAELLAAVNKRLSESEERVCSFDPESLYETRSVGRRALPTTVIGLLVHVCEHTQRHLGQAITISQYLKKYYG